VYGLSIHELFSPHLPKVKVMKIPDRPHRGKRKSKLSPK
jgi:hypothetical protein